MSILTASSVQAALYNVELVDTSAITANEYYATAISEDGAVAGETRNGTDGLPFKQEASFGVDNHFYYLDLSDLEDYCYQQLGYNSCGNWAERQWYGINGAGGLQKEREAYHNGYTSNAIAFDDSGSQLMSSPPKSDAISGELKSGTNNAVVTKFSLDGEVMGITSSGYSDNNGYYGFAYRERGFVGNDVYLPTPESDKDNRIVEKMGRTMLFDSFKYPRETGTTYYVGSGSVAPFDYSDSNKDYGGDLNSCVSADSPGDLRACHHFGFANKGFVWMAGAPNSGLAVTDWKWNYSGYNYDEAAGMASVRGAAVPDSGFSAYAEKPVLVGYNTIRDTSRVFMQAAVFYPEDSFSGVAENAWDTTFIAGATVINNSDDDVYSHSLATGVNENLIVIGEAKLSSAKSGALSNKMFYADAKSGSPSANYFSDGIFFSSAGGHARDINNFNLIVGQVDSENVREYDGKQRRRRGFIYSLGDINNAGFSSPIVLSDNQAWWLDDLTNDGEQSGNNNQFRIIDASAINDKGEIAATATMCEGGYDSTSHNAYCGGGSGTESIVAVKLVPIASGESSDIMPRVSQEISVERQGSGIGVGLLALFSFCFFRRR